MKHMANFARPIGSKDKEPRKRKTLRNIGMGALGAGVGLGTLLLLKKRKVKRPSYMNIEIE